MLRGECMPAFLVCCPPQAVRLQDGPGCATPAAGDPCRTRTCVRCLRGSRLTAGRTGREYVCAEGGGFEPQGIAALADFRNRVPATPTAPSNSFSIASPVRFERTTPAFGGQRSFPLSYGELAPEARLKLTIEASRASVFFTTPLGSDNSAGALQSDAYGTRTRTSRIDDPALVRSSSRASRDIPSLSRAGRIRTGGLGVPNAARFQAALQPIDTAREGGHDPPPPGPGPGVLPVTPLPKGAPPEGRTPICGVRARSVTSYRRDAGGGNPARSSERRR